MSKLSKAQAFKGIGEGLTTSGLKHCGAATKHDIYMEQRRLMEAHPDWSLARCRQRARVEVYLKAAQ